MEQPDAAASWTPASKKKKGKKSKHPPTATGQLPSIEAKGSDPLHAKTSDDLPPQHRHEVQKQESRETQKATARLRSSPSVPTAALKGSPPVVSSSDHIWPSLQNAAKSTVHSLQQRGSVKAQNGSSALRAPEAEGVRPQQGKNRARIGTERLVEPYKPPAQTTKKTIPSTANPLAVSDNTSLRQSANATESSAQATKMSQRPRPLSFSDDGLNPLAHLSNEAQLAIAIVPPAPETQADELFQDLFPELITFDSRHEDTLGVDRPVPANHVPAKLGPASLGQASHDFMRPPRTDQAQTNSLQHARPHHSQFSSPFSGTVLHTSQLRILQNNFLFSFGIAETSVMDILKIFHLQDKLIEHLLQW